MRGVTRRRHADRRLLVVQKPPLCLGGGGLGVDRGARWRGLSDWGRRGACGLGATPFMPGRDTGGIAPIEARHAGDTPKGGF